MKKFRKMCEITTATLSDTNWVLKLLENQDVLVCRFDAGSGREQFIIYEKIQENDSFIGGKYAGN